MHDNMAGLHADKNECFIAGKPHDSEIHEGAKTRQENELDSS